MNKYIGKHIFGIVLGGMICFISACNNDSVSDKQADSFLKYYAAGSDPNSGTVVIQTSAGYTIMGNFESVSGNKDIFVVFTDEFGRQTGETIEIGTDFIDDGNSMIRLGDGYLISGSSFNSNTTQKKGYLVNISSDGQVIWERTYSGYQELEFRDAYYPTSDGHIIITGYSKETPDDGMEAIIFKTNTNGDSLWCKTYSVLDNDVGEAIIEYQNRYHVLATSTDGRDLNLHRIWILNTNTNGRAETSSEIETDYISGKDMTRNTAGNIYILGNSEDPVSRFSKIFLAELELTAGGQITRLKDSASMLYPESLHAESFTPVGQDRLAIGGWQGNLNLIDSEILFLLVDTTFQKIEMLKTYGSKGSQTSQSIIYTSDQGYALTGSVDLAGLKTSMLLKTGSDGELK